MKTNRISHVVLALCLLTVANLASAITPPAEREATPQWPQSNPAHRAIFCGAPGTDETGAEYSAQLKARLDAIAKTQGLTYAEAIKQLRSLSCRD